jgi:hypothetical protein
MSKQEVRNLRASELETVINWADSEGWNPGVNDAESFFAADSSGFFGGYVDDELVASISAVRYHNEFAFIGLYIVLPDFRGTRLTKMLVDKALEVTQEIPTGIDGVVSMQKSYSNYGFRIAHRNIRYEGLLSPISGIKNITTEVKTSESLRELDLECFGVNRDDFLQTWINQEQAFTLQIDEGLGKRGFATVRKCSRGYKIAPLFAESAEVALQLLAGIENRLGSGAHVYIDVPEPNNEAVAIVGSLGMTAVFETARMYRGQWDLPIHKVFGISSFELG